MTKVKDASKFFKEVIAQLTGDTSQKIALSNERYAKAAIKGQISALESQIVTDEEEVFTAQEALKSVLYPSEKWPYSSPQEYTKSILSAQETLDQRQEILESRKNSLELFTKLLEENF